MSQINEILNGIYEEINSVQQNIINFSKVIKTESVKINKDLSF